MADRNNRTPRKRAAKLALAVASMAMFLAGPAQAATVSMSDTNAPPLSLGSILITNLFATYNTPAHGVDFGAGSNVGAGGSGGGSDGTYNYIADDKAAVGQSFTTGANAAGYKVAAVTLRAVVYTSTFSWVPSVNYAIRITKPAGTNTTDSTLTVLATETAEVGVDWANCPTCNIPSVGTGGSRSAGCGRYITFTLGTPVALLPNTLYGFDIGLNTDNIDNTISRHTFYWETDGRGYLPQSGYPPTNNYAGGNAYGSGPWNGTTTGGHGDLTLTNIQGSRAFIVSLNLATTVTPPRFTTQIKAGGSVNTITNLPHSSTFYAGVTAQFSAQVAGDTNLVYQWRTNGVNLSNNTKYGGVTTSTLSVSNVSAGDSGSSFTLVVTNAGGAITSAPATLTVVAAPVAGTYAYTIFTNHPIAYYRLNEFVNPATNPPTFDNIGGGVGRWETNAVRTNGPQPSPFNGFETNNYGTQSKTNDLMIGTNKVPNRSWSTFLPLNLYTNTVTFTAWIYPNGPPGVQGGQYSGFFFTRDNSTECGMQVGDSGTTPKGAGQLAYTWNDGEIRSWASGYTIPANTWSFIGLVITPTNGTVYFATAGGALGSAIDTQWHDVENWSGNWTAGFDPRFSGEYSFNGIVDEVAVWNRSLSLNEMTNIYAAAYTGSSSGSTATAVVSGSATICNGSSTTISAALTGTSPWNVTWSDSVTQNGVATSPATRSVSPSVNTTYTVTSLSDANGAAPSGNLSGSAVITVNARPTSAGSGTATICNGNSTSISAALTGTGPWNVSWSDGSNQIVVATSPATRSVSPSATTTYTVTNLTDANCTAQSGDRTGSAVITVKARPTSVASGTATICNGNSTTISAALTGTGPWNVSWSDGFNQNAVATSPATRSVSPSVNTTYTVTNLTDANCTAQAGDITGSAAITVKARPTSVASGTATICNGSSTSISAALTGTGPWNVSWSDGSNQNAVATSPATRSVSPSATTTYTVTNLTDANCTAQTGDRTGSAVVTVDTTPLVITCATNKTVQCGAAWSFDAPSASHVCCGSNVTITVVDTSTNGTGCTQIITRTWQATDCSTNTDTCSQNVTVVIPDCAPVPSMSVSYAGTTSTISFQSLSCVVYDCQYKDDLSSGSPWATFQTATGTGGIITIQDTLATSGIRFYRVVCRCH